MVSGKKTSLFVDRGAVVTAEELDEYGVWVKSEPEDVIFDENAADGAASMYTDFDTRTGFTDAGDAADAAPFDIDVADGAEALTENFDVDFADGAEALPENFDIDVADEAAALTENFDVDFADEAAALTENFDVDFADEAEGDAVPFDIDVADEAEALPENFDVDFADEAAALPENFNADFADEAEALPENFTEDPGPAAPNSEDFEISLDDIPDEPCISTGEPDETDAPYGEAAKHEETREHSGEYELLLRIAGEISTIKAEINSLKDEISTIRDDYIKPAAESGEIFPAEGGSELNAAETTAMSAETALPNDDTLSGDELDAIINNSEIEIEVDAGDVSAVPQDEVSVDLDLTEPEVVEGSPDDVLSAFAGTLDDSVLEDIVVPAADYFDEVPAEPVPPPPQNLAPEPPRTAPQTPAPPQKLAPEPPRTAPQTPAPPQKPAPEPPRTAPQTPTPPPRLEQPEVLESEYFKKDLQIVLSYMDRLLEALPDEKIEEFARSEQFDVYKKVFKELGLV
jgi:hypothetical protein